VLQSVYAPNQALADLVARAAALTAEQRNKPVATLTQGALRFAKEPNGDSALGNLIADSQLAFARKQGPADVAFMNPGGIRADLTVVPGRATTMSDVIAIQPFGNDIVALTLTGEQLFDILQRQLPKGDAAPRMLQPSSTLRYRWRTGADGTPQLGEILIDGQPLNRSRDYRVVVNNFLSEGGDAQVGFKHGRDRAVLGTDIDALVELLRANPQAVEQAKPGRIVRE
jgi:5'-nucleotidase